LVETLRRQYADSRAAATPRKPTLDEMEKITGRLGRALTVRLDGKGGYRTIQSAIEAAPPYSVIEIQDNGPYYETIHVRPETPGVTIRGRKDCFPVVMTGGPRGKADKVAELDADRTTVERMAFIVGASTGRKEGDQPLWVRRRSQLYSVIAGQAVGTSRTDRATNVWITANSTIENCVLGPLSDAVTIETPVAIRDTVFVQQPLVFQKSGRAQLENVMARTILVKNGPCSAINCTVSEDIEFYGPDSVLEHSIVRSASANQACRIERSNVFGRYLNEAQAGEGCLSIEPGFVNLAEFDLRLGPKSACRGKAADGGDLGARLSAETLEVLRVAAELRKRGVIRF
jgi:hypothetical protein